MLRIVFQFFKQNYLHLVGLHILLCMHWQQPFHNLKHICQQSNVYQLDNYSLQFVFIRDVNWRMKSCSDQTEYFRYTTLLFYWGRMSSGNINIIIIFHTYEFKINSLHSLTSHDQYTVVTISGIPVFEITNYNFITVNMTTGVFLYGVNQTLHFIITCCI